jgi:hypothetical protein
MSRRCVVSVGGGKKFDEEPSLNGMEYTPLQDRMAAAFRKRGETVLSWRGDELPPNCPDPKVKPYAFKVHAIAEAIRQGFGTILWVDSSIMPKRDLLPLWDFIEQQGYWFPDNHTHTCGEWTADSALGPLGITREEAFEIPQCATNTFGLSMRSLMAQKFFEEFQRLEQGTAFIGPKYNHSGEASADPRVRGHRQDQTAASVIIRNLGMKMTPQPMWFQDGPHGNELTYLVLRRTL